MNGEGLPKSLNIFNRPLMGSRPRLRGKRVKFNTRVITHAFRCAGDGLSDFRPSANNGGWLLFDLARTSLNKLGRVSRPRLRGKCLEFDALVIIHALHRAGDGLCHLWPSADNG
jgi:hypothetical protein